MSGVRRGLFRGACALVGLVAGGLLTMGAAAWTETDTPRAPPLEREAAVRPQPLEEITKGTTEEPSKVAPLRSVLLAWAPGGLPASTQRVLERTPGVRAVATINAGLDWIESSRSSDGTVLDRTPGGMAIPFENAYIRPSDFAEFVSPADRDKVRSLDRGETLFPRTSEELRGGGTGVVLQLRSGTLRVTGVVDDVTTSGYEALTAGPTPKPWNGVDRFLLIRLAPKAKTNVIERRLRDLLDPGQPLRLRPSGVNPFLRYGDSVLPQLIIKANFGEFAARPIPGGRLIAIDESWRARNIRSANVPVLGDVVCHHSLIPQLRAAMKEVLARDLGYTIQPEQYAGCFGARFINAGPRHRLSHHAWGIAVDFNASENPTGIRPNLDRRLVSVMREHGFTWGGDWLVPDGMHFEWVKF